MKQAPSNSWPQWRGPSRNGHSAAPAPANWPSSLPKSRWSAPVGIGYSSPAIDGGLVFIAGRDAARGEEICYGIDDATGKVIWKYAYKSDFAPPDPTAGKGPNSTPTVDRGVVVMLGLGGMLHAFATKTGKLLWKHDLKKEYWGVVVDPIGDAWFPVCGASASALAVGDSFVIPVGGKKAGALAAFDRNTGKLLWSALEDRSSYASPILTEIGGVKQYVAFTGKRMVGLEEKTRALLWEFPFTAGYEQTIISPNVWKDRVFVAGEARPTVALKIVAEGGGKVSQSQVWQNAELSSYLSTPIVALDRLIGLDHRSRRIVCLDCESGKTLWTSPTRVAKMFASFTGVGKYLLVLCDTGELLVLDVSAPDFRPVQMYALSVTGPLWSQVSVAGNRLYIRDQNTVQKVVFG